MVFLAVLVLKPTQKEVFDNGAVPIHVGGGPHVIIADTAQQATGKAMMFLPSDLKDKADRVEVSIFSPFRG